MPPELLPIVVPGSVIPELLGPEALEGAGAWAKTTGTNAPTHNASDPARNRAGNLLVLIFVFIRPLLIAPDKKCIVCASNGSQALTMPKLSDATDRVDLVTRRSSSLAAFVRLFYCIAPVILYKDWVVEGRAMP